MPLIAACVVWYDEPLESLERLLRSLPQAADLLVVADGRWGDYDDDGPIQSPLEQRQLVGTLAGELFAGAAVIDKGDGVPWKSQVEKRSFVYGMGARYADWILVIDADEHVESCERAELDTELDASDALAGYVGLRTVYGPSAPEGTWPTPRLFNTVHGLTVKHSHNGVCTTDGRFLAGDPKYVTIEERIDTSGLLRMYHAQGADRSHEREQLDRRYRRRRRETGAEGWPI